MHPLNRLLKNWLKIATAFSVIVLITGLTLGYLYFNTLYLIDYDEKDLILEVKNSENATISFYKRQVALSSDSILGVFEKDGQKKKVIFLYPASSVTAKWQDKETLHLSWLDYRTKRKHQKTLSLPKESYDWRQEN